MCTAQEKVGIGDKHSAAPREAGKGDQSQGHSLHAWSGPLQKVSLPSHDQVIIPN